MWSGYEPRYPHTHTFYPSWFRTKLKSATLNCLFFPVSRQPCGGCCEQHGGGHPGQLHNSGGLHLGLPNCPQHSLVPFEPHETGGNIWGHIPGQWEENDPAQRADECCRDVRVRGYNPTFREPNTQGFS